MAQHKALDHGYDETKRAGKKVPIPYQRNSIEYRFYQDGARMAVNEIEEEENED